MVIREVTEKDSQSLIKLYAQLNPGDLAVPESVFREKLNSILVNNSLYIFVYEDNSGDIIATCYLNIIENLTRNLSSYAVIENVVTDKAHRNCGIGKTMIKYALNKAWTLGCYKTMLLTGSKKKATLHFYESCGFMINQKTAFIAHPA